MSIKDSIQADMKTAMKAGDKERLGTIRLMMAAIKQVEVDERIEIDDARVLAVLDKMVKQRRESIAQYESAGRQELADKELTEIQVIQTYLPEPLTDAEVEALIEEAIAATGATSIKDMGKLMGMLKGQLQGRADIGAVSARIKARLAG